MRAGRFACAILAGFAWAASADSPIAIAFPRPGARLPGIARVYCIGAVPTVISSLKQQKTKYTVQKLN